MKSLGIRFNNVRLEENYGARPLWSYRCIRRSQVRFVIQRVLKPIQGEPSYQFTKSSIKHLQTFNSKSSHQCTRIVLQYNIPTHKHTCTWWWWLLCRCSSRWWRWLIHFLPCYQPCPSTTHSLQHPKWSLHLHLLAVDHRQLLGDKLTEPKPCASYTIQHSFNDTCTVQ